MEDNQELLKVSEDYKKGFNQADMMCTYMPNVVKSIEIPNESENEYTNGFRDGILQCKAKQRAMKKFSFKKVLEKKSGDTTTHDKSRTKKN